VPVEQQREKVDVAVARLQALGATFVERAEELGVVWAVMLDPEGNEFCA
jgi:predicted enzyme related to lactoylglutathione lyase